MRTGSIQAFILSAPRSGSTLLRRLLSAVPGVVSLPETHFFLFHRKNRHLALSDPAQKRRYVDNWVSYHTVQRFPFDRDELRAILLERARGPKDVLDLTVAHHVAYVGVERPFVVEKSPPHIFYRREIHDFYPDAKIILLVRDPRDVAASLKTCHWSTSNVLSNATIWTKGVRTHEESDYVLKYERLVEQPEQTLEELCGYLGVPYEAIDFDAAWDDEVERNVPTSSNALRPVSTEHMGYHMLKLTVRDREREIVQSVCRKMMIELGYPFERETRDARFYALYMLNWMHMLCVRHMGRY